MFHLLSFIIQQLFHILGDKDTDQLKCSTFQKSYFLTATVKSLAIFMYNHAMFLRH